MKVFISVSIIRYSVKIKMMNIGENLFVQYLLFLISVLDLMFINDFFFCFFLFGDPMIALCDKPVFIFDEEIIQTPLCL